jgi:hypothetical protein
MVHPTDSVRLPANIPQGILTNRGDTNRIEKPSARIAMGSEIHAIPHGGQFGGAD